MRSAPPNHGTSSVHSMDSDVAGGTLERGLAHRSPPPFEGEGAKGAEIDSCSAIGEWIDRVRRQRPPELIVLDRDLSESPICAEQDGSACNVISETPATTRCSVFNQFGYLERSRPAPARHWIVSRPSSSSRGPYPDSRSAAARGEEAKLSLPTVQRLEAAR
jgi:hypothetical protein